MTAVNIDDGAIILGDNAGVVSIDDLINEWNSRF